MWKKICPAWLEAAFGNVDGRRCVGGYHALLQLCYILDVSKVMKRQKRKLLDTTDAKKHTRNKKVISWGLLHFLWCVFLDTCDFKTHALSKQSHSRLSLSWLRTASRETALITCGFWSHVWQGKTHRRKYRPLAWWHFFISLFGFLVSKTFKKWVFLDMLFFLRTLTVFLL